MKGLSNTKSLKWCIPVNDVKQIKEIYISVRNPNALSLNWLLQDLHVCILRCGHT